MPLSRRAFLQLTALGAASLAGNLQPGRFTWPLTSSGPALRVLTTGRPALDGVVTAFTKATGRAVQFSGLESADLAGYDLAIVPAYQLTPLIRTGQVQPLGIEPVRSDQRPYDPSNLFSLPVGRGAIGINARWVEPPVTWAEFFQLAATTPTFLPPTESFHAALKHLAGSLNTRNSQVHYQARRLLETLASVPLARAQWALGPQLPGWQFGIPLTGTELWEDCLCLPATSPNPQLARTFLQLASDQPLAPLPASALLEPRSPFAPKF